MPSARLAGLVALLPLCVACQTAFAAPGGAAPAQAVAADFLPAAERPLELRVGDGQLDHLEQVLELLSQSTGVAFTIDEGTRNELRRASTGLSADVTVPAEEAWRWAEGLLVHRGFQLGAISQRPPVLLGVYPMTPRGDFMTRPKPIHLKADDLDLCVEHPAFSYTTVVEMPHVDVRQLANSLRALTHDPRGTQMVLAVGNSNALIVTGVGSNVADMVSLLLAIEEQARRAWEDRPADSDDASAPSAPGPAGPGSPGRTSPPGRG